MATAAEATSSSSSNNTNSSGSVSEMNDSKIDTLEEFVRIGRTGRRNAVTDVNLGIKNKTIFFFSKIIFHST